jgi:malonyl CoA-acyl carrier protein transacylase
MPLPHFLALILAVIATAGLTIWAAAGFGVSLGVVAVLALATALALRALAWH